MFRSRIQAGAGGHVCQRSGMETGKWRAAGDCPPYGSDAVAIPFPPHHPLQRAHLLPQTESMKRFRSTRGHL